jgi:hypothetical protein
MVTRRRVREVKFDDAGRWRMYEGHEGEPLSLSGVGSSPPPEPPAEPEDLGTLKEMDIVGFNKAAERQFVEILRRLCRANPGGVPVRVVRAECAFRLGVSTETVKRYLEKWTAPSAPFRLLDGMVLLKEGQNDQ